MIILNVISSMVFFVSVVNCLDYGMILKSSAPAIGNVNVTFTANLMKNGTTALDENTKWEWNLDDGETHLLQTETSHAEWIYVFPKTLPTVRVKEYQVHVKAIRFINSENVTIAENEIVVEITDVLNGELVLKQNENVQKSGYISSASPLAQTIFIGLGDFPCVANASLTVYWFDNCDFVGEAPHLFSSNVYEIENSTHNIQALLVASLDPHPLSYRTEEYDKTDKENNNFIFTAVERTAEDKDLPYVCNSKVAPDPNKIYGHFAKNFTVRNPITKPVVSGDVIINPGDKLSLNISWSGSPPYEYCYKIISHDSSINNDTCADVWHPTTMPIFSINHETHAEDPIGSILVQVRNQVSNITEVVTVTVRKRSTTISIVTLICVVAVVILIVYVMLNIRRGQKYNHLFNSQINRFSTIAVGLRVKQNFDHRNNFSLLT